MFAAALFGAGIGFLWYNTYPAQVFMGDVGALSLGGSIGMLAVLTKNEIVLLIVGGLFVIEALSRDHPARRVQDDQAADAGTGKRVFAMAPIHHHYEKKGWDEPKIIVRFWLVSLLFALLALGTLERGCDDAVGPARSATSAARRSSSSASPRPASRSRSSARGAARASSSPTASPPTSSPGRSPQLAGVPVTWQLGGHDLRSVHHRRPGRDVARRADPARDDAPRAPPASRSSPRSSSPTASSIRARTLIAITGTNGKSTTTALTGELCEASGAPTFCGGNLGNMPLIDAVDHPANAPGGLIVAEVAAFMLENCTTFRAQAGVLTNITEDHLDRFGTMERYAEIKGRIWDWQRPDDLAIAQRRRSVDDGARPPASRRSCYTFDSRPGATAERGAVISADRERARAARHRRCRPRGALPDVDDLGDRRQPQPGERDVRVPRGARGRRAGRRGPRRRARLPAAAAPHGAGRRPRRHLLLRRQQGHQRRLGRGLACAASRARSC